jgi:hypothetical protein
VFLLQRSKPGLQDPASIDIVFNNTLQAAKRGN